MLDGSATGIAFVVYQLSTRMIGISLLGASHPRSLPRSPVRALLNTLLTPRSRVFGPIKRNCNCNDVSAGFALASFIKLLAPYTRGNDKQHFILHIMSASYFSAYYPLFILLKSIPKTEGGGPESFPLQYFSLSLSLDFRLGSIIYPPSSSGKSMYLKS